MVPHRRHHHLGVRQHHQAALYVGDEVVAATRAVAEKFVNTFAYFGGALGDLITAVKKFGDAAGAVLQAIVNDPQGFITNVLGGLDAGFSQFFDATHFQNTLQTKLLDWLTGGSLPAGLSAPATLNPGDLGPWLLKFFQLDWNGVQTILVNTVGAGNVALLADIFDAIQAAWDKGVNTGEIFNAVKAILAKGAPPDQLSATDPATAVQTKLVSLVLTTVARKAPTVIAEKPTPQGAVLSTIYARELAGEQRGGAGHHAH